ncbi:MAG: hypothetical protein JWN93_3114, partial [Hyphomicrobiales bacterium]|nr:hypothetical protein [Hyphomicrobiales bacterium]
MAASLVLAFFAGSCATLFALTRRPRFSFVIVALVFIGVYGFSAFKFRLMAMNLHVYDVAFYLFSFAQIGFFRETYPGAALLAGLGIAGALLALGWSWLRERPRAIGRGAFAACAFAGVAASAGAT